MENVSFKDELVLTLKNYTSFQYIVYGIIIVTAFMLLVIEKDLYYFYPVLFVLQDGISGVINVTLMRYNEEQFKLETSIKVFCMTSFVLSLIICLAWLYVSLSRDYIAVSVLIFLFLLLQSVRITETIKLFRFYKNS